MYKYLVCIAKKHTKEVVAFVEIEATDWINAVEKVFDQSIGKQNYNGNDHYGEAIKIS